MRIVTWNCQTGFSKKVDALLSLRPDVAVIPECSEAAVDLLQGRGYHAVWFGENPLKGMAVASQASWELRVIQEPEHKFIAAIEVNAPQPFTLIAVWACLVGTKKAANYIGQVYKALTSHPEWFGRSPVVVAGDFNSNSIWDAERPVGNHSAVVKLLEGHGLASAYHTCFNEAQGKESQPTFYFYRKKEKPFHLDYIFLPGKWSSRCRVEVGCHAQWSKLSDHCPVVADIEE